MKSFSSQVLRVFAYFVCLAEYDTHLKQEIDSYLIHCEPNDRCKCSTSFSWLLQQTDLVRSSSQEFHTWRTSLFGGTRTEKSHLECIKANQISDVHFPKNAKPPIHTTSKSHKANCQPCPPRWGGGCW